VAHGARRRRYERRLAARPEDDHAPRRRRLHAVLVVRRHEALLPPHGRLHDPEPALRRLRRLHEPLADLGDARIRRHVRVLCRRDPHEPDRRDARDRPARAPPEEREPDRRPNREPRPAQRPVDGPRCARGGRPDRLRAGGGVQADDERAALGRPASRPPTDVRRSRRRR
jgi:hypothetical protein